MRQELKFYRTEKAIEIEAEGQVIATLPMIEEQPTPAPEPTPEPQPKSERYAFAEWNPQVTHTRLTEPKTQWAVLNSLSETAQKVLANLITILLGLTIASRMTAQEFIQVDTLIIIGLGLFAFIFDTFGGIMLAKFMNLFMKNKINPMIGAAGISAFPMSSRVVHKMGLAEDNQNFLLMHAVGVNVSGQIASVIAGGLLLTIVQGILG